MLKRLPEKSMGKFPALLNNVENSLGSMKKVIGDLIDSRWKQQREQTAEELIDLGNILEDVRLTLAPQIQESGAVITVDLNNCSEVTFIRRKLRSIVYNLLSNAIQYRSVDRKPEITVTSTKEKEYIVLSVADNGIGMNKEEQKIIFEKFKRIRTTNEGSGVGLYLVNTMVTEAGGRIEVESEPEKGSVFKVFIKHN
ncbi:sensor histidine kinase [Chryseobacterium gregarium]|uniref:sensor histidine kinase n=1 Tax=Chryseobacterium gregarium TaxID=456299 RepID=UPI00373FDB56